MQEAREKAKGGLLEEEATSKVTDRTRHASYFEDRRSFPFDKTMLTSRVFTWLSESSHKKEHVCSAPKGHRDLQTWDTVVIFDAMFWLL
jgi:hypothetical protein